MTRSWIGLLAVAAAVTLLAGCGSGGPVEPAKLTSEQEAKMKAEQKQADAEESGDVMNSQVGTPKKKW